MWGWAHFTVWLCLGGALGFAAEPAEDTSAKPLENVREALGRRDLEAASAEIERQLDRKPDDVEWLLLRADLVGARGRVAEALSQTRTIRERYPESRLARMKEAQWLTRLGRLNSAEVIYEALLAEATSAEIRSLLGLTHQWRGDWQRASELFGEALRESREDSLPFLGELRGLVAMGQTSRAWVRARQRDAATGESDAELGLVLAGIAGGVDAWEQVDALASRPVAQLDLAQAQASLRAVHWARAGQLDRALELLRSIAEAQPPHYDAYIEAADGYAAVDEQVLARRYYLHARELTPERPEAWLGLARLASREGRLSGSLALYQQITADNPEAFEGWLGQIRMAQLLEETALAEAALEQAWQLAPRSALLHRERLRLALRRGDLQAFREGLRHYLRDQPGDQLAQLLNGQVRLIDGEPMSTDEIRGWFDPLAPELGSQVIRLALRASGSRTAALEGLPLAPSPDLVNAANAKLAERLALVAEPEAALEVADRGDPALAVWIDSVAQGWWAYLSTPVAFGSQLAQDFDPQARAVWLASQIQNRLRNLTIETESPLEEEWLLTRAAWFQRWQGRWASTEAALDLERQLGGFIGSWADGVSHWELEEAWRRSDQPIPPALDTLPRRITQARWRQYRFDFAGALQVYQRLEELYPDAADPIYAQIQILRASGRWSEAASLLRRLALTAAPPPLVRLQYAELLRRMGRFAEARQQLDQLEAEGFEEPELYLYRARLARSEARDGAFEAWLRQGLERYPQATELLRLQAERWLERRQTRELAAWLAQKPTAGWCHPDLLAAAWPELDPAGRTAILESAAWWFNWQWLPWERLEARSIAELERRSREAASAGQPDLALRQLVPALEARIPESELWLKAARLYDFNGQHQASARAYRLAELLGLGRPDAAISELIQESRRRPVQVAREFARRLDTQPDDPALQKGLVTALLRAGEANAAALALAPLLTAAPDDLEVRMLAAEVKGAQGRIRQGRSLYNSILRNDPLAADAHAGLLALAEYSEWGVSAGYEYDVVRDTSELGAGFSDWQEAFLSTYWRRPFRQTWALEYRWYDRYQAQAHQLSLDWTRALDRDWIVRLNAAGAQDEEIIAQWRAGGGVSRRLADTLWVGLDGRYLDFVDVNVWQWVPGVTWRWHPRGTLEGRLYLSDNRFEVGTTETSLTWLVQASWQIGRQSLATLFYAQGDEDSLDPIPGLIANDRYLSVGGSLRLGLNRHWVLQPAYRFERHEQFDLHGLGLTLTRRY